MRISSSSSPTVLQRLPDGAREDVAPATDDGIAQETLPAAAHSSGSGGLDWSGIGLEAQLQKSALASLRVPPFQALPRVFADLKVLKFPTAGLQKPKPLSPPLQRLSLPPWYGYDQCALRHVVCNTRSAQRIVDRWLAQQHRGHRGGK